MISRWAHIKWINTYIFYAIYRWHADGLEQMIDLSRMFEFSKMFANGFHHTSIHRYMYGKMAHDMPISFCTVSCSITMFRPMLLYDFIHPRSRFNIGCVCWAIFIFYILIRLCIRNFSKNENHISIIQRLAIETHSNSGRSRLTPVKDREWAKLVCMIEQWHEHEHDGKKKKNM